MKEKKLIGLPEGLKIQHAILSLASGAIMAAIPFYVYRPKLGPAGAIAGLAACVAIACIFMLLFRENSAKRFEEFDPPLKALSIALLAIGAIELIIFAIFILSPASLGIFPENPPVPDGPKISTNYGLIAEAARKSMASGDYYEAEAAINKLKDSGAAAGAALEDACMNSGYAGSALCSDKAKALACHQKIVAALSEINKSAYKLTPEQCKSMLASYGLAECGETLHAFGLSLNYFNNLCSPPQGGSQPGPSDNPDDLPGEEGPPGDNDPSADPPVFYDPNEGKNACLLFGGHFCEIGETCPGILLESSANNRCCNVPCESAPIESE